MIPREARTLPPYFIFLLDLPLSPEQFKQLLASYSYSLPDNSRNHSKKSDDYRFPS